MELLVAKDEQLNHQLCGKLPKVSTEQNFPPPTLRAVFPTRTAICTMVIDSNGLYHGATTVGGIRSTLGSHRPIHQNGTLHPAGKRKENGGRFGGQVCTGNMKTP